MSPPLHSPQEFPRWSVCVHSWSVPALPGVSPGSAACLRTAQPPGVPKVACACAFLFRASAPGSIPRWRSMSPHPGVSQGSAACLRTAQPPGVPKVACACTFLAVLSFLLVVAAHALTHARAGLLARACTRIRARLRMHTCGHTPTSAEKTPGPRTPRARRRCPTRSPIAPPPLAMARTCTRFPAAERRQQHARRKDKARRLTQVPWAESRRPLAQTTALPHRMGPERPMLAMTVKVFFLRRRRKVYSKLTQ